MLQTAESLDQLKENIYRVNRFQSPVTLAVDHVSFRCNLPDDMLKIHSLRYATKLDLKWIPVRVLRLSLGLANNYFKVPESFLNLPCSCKSGFAKFRAKES